MSLSLQDTALDMSVSDGSCSTGCLYGIACGLRLRNKHLLVVATPSINNCPDTQVSERETLDGRPVHRERAEVQQHATKSALLLGANWLSEVPDLERMTAIAKRSMMAAHADFAEHFLVVLVRTHLTCKLDNMRRHSSSAVIALACARTRL